MEYKRKQENLFTTAESQSTLTGHATTFELGRSDTGFEACY